MTLISNPQAEISRAQSATLVTISPAELRRIALSGEEIAVVDVREGDVYISGGHISISVELPLSELELKAHDLLPRLSVTLVVVDDDGASLAKLAAQRLAGIGYSDVRVLEGGGVEADQGAARLEQGTRRSG
jgi:rhodanese-related sulfurtransferase